MERYAVVVIEQKGAIDGDPFSWGQLNHVNRLNEHVAKGLLLCYIVHPPDSHDFDLSACLSQCKIVEVVVRRYVHKNK